MPWPTTTAFSESIQNPGVCFRGNSELAGSAAATTPRGLPLVYSGNFACVYKVKEAMGKDVAVRCFTREVRDQQQRYDRLSEYLKTALPETFVDFEYLPQGILVKSQWYPIVKMDWANGEPLDKFVRQNLDKPDAISGVAARWRGAVGSLRGLGIAHNDLQHGNVMVQADNRLHLVDYDGIFLPQFQGELSPEIGHKNYQHPQRSAKNYDAQIDNFPALVVYLSLLALRADPKLWDRFYNDDNLLLTNKDYEAPKESECFQALQQSPNETVRKLAVQLERYCALPVEQVPDLESILGVAPPLRPAIAAPSATPAASPASPGAYQSRRRNSQGQPQPQQPASPVSSLTKCPQCGRNNDKGLIYCVNSSCQATLLTTTRICSCRSHIPSNARFCPVCGSPTGPTRRRAAPAWQPAPPANPAPRPVSRPVSRPAPAAGKTCSSCRSPMSAAAIYCTRCGVVSI